jgi:hypothetical protein
VRTAALLASHQLLMSCTPNVSETRQLCSRKY